MNADAWVEFLRFAFSGSKLQRACDRLDIGRSGSKEELIERLLREVGTHEALVHQIGYADLLDTCRELGLPRQGPRAALADRIIAAAHRPTAEEQGYDRDQVTRALVEPERVTISGPVAESELISFPSAAPRDSVDVLTYVIDEAGWERFDEMVGLSERQVRVVTRKIDPRILARLQGQLNVEIRHHAALHAKLVRVGRDIYVGSFNLTGAALQRNIEIQVRVTDPEGDVARMFDSVWEEADEKFELTHPTAALALLNPEPLALVPFQQDLMSAVLDWLERGQPRSRLLQLPTGAGKTAVSVHAASRHVRQQPGDKVLWVSHRRELVRQAAVSFLRVPDPSLRIWTGSDILEGASDPRISRTPRNADVLLVTQQSWESAGDLDHVSLVIVDEAHRFHEMSARYSALESQLGRVLRLGLTATPLDDDDKGFANLWDTSTTFGSEIARTKLRNDGFLATLDGTHSTAVKTGFEFRLDDNPDAEGQILNRVREFDHPAVNKAIAKAFDEASEWASRILLFGVTVEHVERLKRERFARDKRVRLLHSWMSPDEIRAAFDWFRTPREAADEPRMLMTVLMATEGTDFPLADCLFMARPTFSNVLYEQMLGRAVRGPEFGGTARYGIVDFTSSFIGPGGEHLRQVTSGAFD